jgi:N4-gp56 family major capsid protein
MPVASPLTYGDISPRTAAYAVVDLLKRGHEDMILEKFGQTYVLPTKSTKTAKFRRYEVLPLATTPLVEGVTPAGTKPTFTDYTVSIEQYGDFIPYTDAIEDTHEDPVLKENTALLTQQATETIETLRWNVVKAGTNVFYANGTVRTDVNTPITLALQRKATRALLRQRAKHIREIVSSDTRFNKESIARAFVGICHTDVENDIRNIPGYTDPKNYSGVVVWANEIGSVENVRYVRSTLFTPFLEGGGTKGAMIGVTQADVYPVIIFAQDAYGIVPLKGKSAASIIAHNPGSSGSSDPLNQRGTIGWKTWQASVILNDLWLVRLEVAATN